MSRVLLATAFVWLFCSSVAAQQLPMPSQAHKDGFRLQFEREGAVASDPFLSSSERLAANGFMVRYLNAPSGSAAERDAWAGLTPYLLLRQQRQASVEGGVRAEMAATQRWMDERSEERRINTAKGVELYNRVCAAHQVSDLRWTHAETTEALRLLDEAIVLGVNQDVMAESIPHNCRPELHEENDWNEHHDREAIIRMRDPGAEMREYNRQRQKMPNGVGVTATRHALNDGPAAVAERTHSDARPGSKRAVTASGASVSRAPAQRDDETD